MVVRRSARQLPLRPRPPRPQPQPPRQPQPRVVVEAAHRPSGRNAVAKWVDFNFLADTSASTDHHCCHCRNGPGARLVFPELPANTRTTTTLNACSFFPSAVAQFLVKRRDMSVTIDGSIGPQYMLDFCLFVVD